MEKWVYLVARKTYELGTFYLCDPRGDEYCAMVAVTLSAAMQRLGSGEIELYSKIVNLVTAPMFRCLRQSKDWDLVRSNCI